MAAMWWRYWPLSLACVMCPWLHDVAMEYVGKVPMVGICSKAAYFFVVGGPAGGACNNSSSVCCRCMQKGFIVKSFRHCHQKVF
jgi:hypothetical protein